MVSLTYRDWITMLNNSIRDPPPHHVRYGTNNADVAYQSTLDRRRRFLTAHRLRYPRRGSAFATPATRPFRRPVVRRRNVGLRFPVRRVFTQRDFGLVNRSRRAGVTVEDQARFEAINAELAANSAVENAQRRAAAAAASAAASAVASAAESSGPMDVEAPDSPATVEMVRAVNALDTIDAINAQRGRKRSNAEVFAERRSSYKPVRLTAQQLANRRSKLRPLSREDIQDMNMVRAANDAERRYKSVRGNLRRLNPLHRYGDYYDADGFLVHRGMSADFPSDIRAAALRLRGARARAALSQNMAATRIQRWWRSLRRPTYKANVSEAKLPDRDDAKRTRLDFEHRDAVGIPSAALEVAPGEFLI